MTNGRSLKKNDKLRPLGPYLNPKFLAAAGAPPLPVIAGLAVAATAGRGSRGAGLGWHVWAYMFTRNWSSPELAGSPVWSFGPQALYYSRILRAGAAAVFSKSPEACHKDCCWDLYHLCMKKNVSLHKILIDLVTLKSHLVSHQHRISSKVPSAQVNK